MTVVSLTFLKPIVAAHAAPRSRLQRVPAPVAAATRAAPSDHRVGRRGGVGLASHACASRAGGCRTAGSAPRFVAASATSAPQVATAEAEGAVDWAALVRYFAATALQLAFLVSLMFFADRVLLPRLPASVGTGFVAAFFLVNSFFSRKLSVLDNRRPTLASERDAISSRKRPAWMPKPIVFPIVWSTIGVLRTIAATLVWQQTGALTCWPLIFFMAHLAIGDTWNTINNVEQRLGVACIGVLFVLGSATWAVSQYATVLPLAAYVLSPLLLWLSIASALVWDIWRVNGGLSAYPLYPTLASRRTA